MPLTESDRIKTKLLALNIRLAELRMEREKTQLRVVQLERRIGDARLAGLMGEAEASPHLLDPELEQAQALLESQEDMIRQVRKSQGETQVRYLLTRRQEEIGAGTTPGDERGA